MGLRGLVFVVVGRKTFFVSPLFLTRMPERRIRRHVAAIQRCCVLLLEIFNDPSEVVLGGFLLIAIG
jgi:hypothetical protein